VYRLNSHDEFQPPLPSDLTVLQIPLGDEMEFVPSEAWFETPGQSLAEALVMGASRALGIEDDELEGGFRTRSAEHADIDARGVIEVFLFDTTAGGAGFHRASGRNSTPCVQKPVQSSRVAHAIRRVTTVCAGIRTAISTTR